MEQSPLDPLFMILSPVHTASGERTNIAAVGRTSRCAGGQKFDKLHSWAVGGIPLDSGRNREWDRDDLN